MASPKFGGKLLKRGVCIVALVGAAAPGCTRGEYLYGSAFGDDGGASLGGSSAQAGAQSTSGGTGGAGGAVGIAGSTSTPLRRPACSGDEAGAEAASTVLAAANSALLAYWTFDEGTPSDDGQWKGSPNGGYSLAGADGSAEGSYVGVIEETRTGDAGAALSFDGNATVTLSQLLADQPLLPTDFTLSAWFQPDNEALRSPEGLASSKWTIFSSRGDACGGLEIFVLWTGSGDEGYVGQVHFRVENPNPTGNPPCTTSDVYVTMQPGNGYGWTHVAASYAQSSPRSARMALHLDTSRGTSSPRSSSADVSVDGVPAGDALHVGATVGPQAVSAGFMGYIDDIAIFDRALPVEPISAFLRDQCSVPGPSGCRWSAWGFPDTWGYGASTALWTDSSTPSKLTVSITDVAQSQAGITATLANPGGKGLDLSRSTTAYLRGAVPNGKPFVVFLNLDDCESFCAWSKVGMGDEQEYELNLAHPSFCDSSAGRCDLNLNDVRSVSVASESGQSWGELEFTVTGLEFDEIKPQETKWGNYRGFEWPEGWCWHPKAYESKAKAEWDEDPPVPGSLRARLGGDGRTGSSLAATFPHGPIDLSEWCGVEVDGSLPFDGQASVVLNDANGMWRSWTFQRDANGDRDPRISFADRCWDPYNADGGRLWPDYDRLPDFDESRVASFTIQKPWDQDGDTDIVITSVRRINDCETPAQEAWDRETCEVQ